MDEAIARVTRMEIKEQRRPEYAKEEYERGYEKLREEFNEKLF